MILMNTSKGGSVYLKWQPFTVDEDDLHCEFQCFFVTLYLALLVPSGSSHLNWKIANFFGIQFKFQMSVFILDISIDEQTIEYQGRHPAILRINYKLERVGSQCASLCCDGYACTIYFRSQSHPTLFIDIRMFPLHDQVHATLDQLLLQHYK